MLERPSPMGRWPVWAVVGIVVLGALAVVTSYAAWRDQPALGMSSATVRAIAPFVAVAFVFYASIVGRVLRRRARS